MVARGTGPAQRSRGSRRVGRAASLGVLAGTLVTLLAGCSASNIGKAFDGFGWPIEGISKQSQQMYDVWIGSTIAALVVGVFVWGLIFWCIIRYRKRGEELPAQTRYNMPIELLYTITPFLIVSVLFYYTAIVQTNVDKRTPNPDVTVEVVAFKWNWEFRYLNEDARGANGQPVSTVGSSDVIPVLVLPINERVRFTETSRDVIHSFWVPDLLFKRDVLPGDKLRNEFEVDLQQEGSYVGRCAELCGAYHAMMNFEVRVVSQDKFDQFIAAKKTGMSTPDALQSIGQSPFATTTHPFESKPGQLADKK